MITDKKVITIKRTIDGKERAWMFDPEAGFLFTQNSQVEKILLKINFNKKASDAFLKNNSFNQSIEDIRGKLAANATPEEVEAAVKRDVKFDSAPVIAAFTEIQTELVMTDSIEQLLCALLVPEGQPWSGQTAADVKNLLIPSLTQSECDEVLGAFFTFERLSKGVTENYLFRSMLAGQTAS